ncbi:DNA-3-methyladenine glycosylase I [Corynebacterium sp. TAE3-ERU2]|uniref:DNA-3-methyladenine glycosylase I n=1 Tax=Corynebacterium sp. TAE3-ERU2 TaxID=2849497 RepID=UPI001C46C243|nr:DNA-3-methyladenine glycosylase I [Corynebacterium sp. TAE3-ERU2]MBV7302375.1 DNA-3-methyladenine glycosylase I [Corynebacterium sp. TAE3-ERU2]
MNTTADHTAVSSPEQYSPEQRGLTQGEDGRWRIPWGNQSAQLRDYYDNEWAHPVRDERGIYERLVLEGFQAGLSWRTILQKRPAFRQAFAHFDPEKVAAFDEADIQRLLENPAIIRNRAKITAAISNAQVLLRTRESAPLPELLARYQQPLGSRFAHVDHIPTTSPEAAELARELKSLGYRFVGPTTCYALMQASGLVETRVEGESRC